MNKIVLIIISLFINLFGLDDFEYKINVSNKNVVVKEAVIISVVMRQKNLDDVMRFELLFGDSKNYKIKLLESQDAKDAKGRTFVKSEYLLFPFKEGSIKIEPILTIKRASKEELKKFVTGSADELMYLQTRNRSVDLAPFELNVEALESDIILVGDFELEYKIDKQSIGSDEQVNIVYTLSGRGYKPEFDTLLGDIENVDTFKDYEHYDKKLFHKIVYRYALKCDNDFTIPEISLAGYNPKLKKRYVLKAPSFQIHVAKVTQNSSLSKRHSYNFAWERYLNYLLLFLAGFFIEKLLKKLPQKSLSNDEIFIKTVKNSKTPKELLQYLISQQNHNFKREIEQLEMTIYQDREFKLSSIKSSIVERFLTLDKYSI